MIKLIKDLFYQTDGKYTQELKLVDSQGELGKFPERLIPDGVKTSVCGFCATGCQLDIHIKDGQPVNLTPSHQSLVNMGEACPKGWEALTPLKAKDRATMPRLRNSQGTFEDISWSAAMTQFVNRFTAVQEQYGAESVAFLSTGQIPIEEMAALGVLAKFGMGVVHGDGNTRQCMATAVTAYKQSFGFDAPPYTYKDFEKSDCLIFVGANPCLAHPIMWERVAMNPHNPNIVVLDPRKTETAMAATHHYALNPKSDLTLLYGIAHLLIESDWIDQDYIDRHTRHFEDFKQHVKRFTPAFVAEQSGLSVEQIKEFARLIHMGKRVSFWWTMGVNQGHEAVRTAQALINLALMTGNIGRVGTGANSITGQCNAMGSRLYSNTTNLLGGYDFMNPVDRAKIADILDIDVNKIPKVNSWSYDKIVEGIAQNRIKGLWVIATNPAHSWINRNEFQEYIKNLDFLVVQDMYHSTETAQIADLILPAAGWGEKDGTFINSERRIGRIQKVSAPPGAAQTDFDIFKMIAQAWGCGHLFSKWNTVEDVFQTLKAVSKDQPCDMTGIKDYDMLDQHSGIQWPFRPEDDIGSNERRLFEDGLYYHSDYKARFLFEEIRDKPESTNDEYPFELLTGRGTSSQWHTQTRTSKSAVLRKLYPAEIYVEINPHDAQRLNIYAGQVIFVSTRRGRIRAKANIIPTLQSGVIFIPMHYLGTNMLTFPAYDPYSRQPSYKSCAAKITTHEYGVSA